LQILNEISQHKIKIYEFPDTEDEEETKLHRVLRDRVPFAVVGSNTVIEVDGKKIRGRKYPWGIAEGVLQYHIDRTFIEFAEGVLQYRIDRTFIEFVMFNVPECT
jgi:septin family protein